MQHQNKITAFISVLFYLGLFLFISSKAHVSSFTHDESYSYNHYVHESFMDIISNKDAYTNNHPLNTVGMKYCEMLFGSSEMALRLPNLLALLIFFLYGFLLFKNSRPVLRITIMLLLFSNTFLIDFFGLARGYGLSIGFMVMGLYHLVRALSSPKKHHLVLFNAASLLAVLSNYTMLDFYVVGLFTFNLVLYTEYRFVLHKKFSFFSINKINILLFVLNVMILYEPVRRAVMFNNFDFGGKEGFISSTMISLIHQMFTNIDPGKTAMVVIILIFLVLSFLPLGITLMKLSVKDKDFFAHNRNMIAVNLVLLGISLVTILQHYLFKTDYLMSRFALFLIPLFIINLGFLYDYLLQFRFQTVLNVLFILLSLLYAFNFYRNANLYSCAEWAYDMNTKNMISNLEQNYIADALSDRNTPAQISLGINWLFEPTINFYRSTKKLKWLKEVNRDGFKGNFNYYYIFASDTTGLNLKKVINIYPQSNTIFAK